MPAGKEGGFPKPNVAAGKTGGSPGQKGVVLPDRPPQGKTGGAPDGSTPQGVQVAQAGFTRPAAQEAPAILGITPEMTGLQMRSLIATRGVEGDSIFRSPEAGGFFRNVAQRSLISDDGTLASSENILPIERQFTSDVLGLTVKDESTKAFLEAIQE